MAKDTMTRAGRRRHWLSVQRGSGAEYVSRWGVLASLDPDRRLPVPHRVILIDPGLSEEDREEALRKTIAADRAPLRGAHFGGLVFTVVLAASLVIPGRDTTLLLAVAAAAVAFGLAAGAAYTRRLRNRAALPPRLRERVLTTGGSVFIRGSRSEALVAAAETLGDYENTPGVDDKDVDEKWRQVWDDASVGHRWETQRLAVMPN